MSNEIPVFGIVSQVKTFDDQGGGWTIRFRFDLTRDSDNTKQPKISTLINNLQQTILRFCIDLIKKLAHPETNVKLEQFLTQNGEHNDT